MGYSRKILSEERGQASLMIGMMMMTFILLFAFVVNTGMLVNAKINLQNAADLAAYAGAAVQARQLDDISYLNYDMRRQYKKFLFRYYVVGNMASQWFPRPGGQSTDPPTWGPGPSANIIQKYGVPAVCVDFSTTGSLDDYCQAGQLQHVVIPPSNDLDQINQTLRNQLQAIETLRQGNCGKIGDANTTLLTLWLYNTSPDLSNLINQTSGDLQAIMKVEAGAAQGLGLVPRELILSERINSLKDYVNMPPQSNVNIAAVNAMKTSTDPASNERTIQAFLSAYYTLGNNTFDDDTHIIMDELLPNGGDQAQLLKLNTLSANFDTYSVQFKLLPTQNNDGSADCIPDLTPITVWGVPMGVAKDPSVLTFYAIRLRATAKVMFNPFPGDMELTAYAAARPFGSRIGPPDAAFTFTGLSPSLQIVPPPQNPANALPNLPFTQQDLPLAVGKGWDSTSVLSTLYNQFPSVAGQSGNGAAIGEDGFTWATRAAMVPNPIEGNKYNILNDLQDPFVTSFDNLHQMSFWAPIVPPSKASDLKNVVTQDLQNILSQASQSIPAGNKINGGNPAAAILGSLTGDLIQYLTQVEAGNGEILAGTPSGGRCDPGSCVQEGMYVAHVQDPFVQQDASPIQLPFTIQKDAQHLKTSYVTTNDPAFTTLGRVGYSVKYISFSSLLKGTDTTGGGTVVKPSGFLDTQAQQDTAQIQH